MMITCHSFGTLNESITSSRNLLCASFRNSSGAVVLLFDFSFLFCQFDQDHRLANENFMWKGLTLRMINIIIIINFIWV